MFEEEVSRGSKWLDQVAPGWEERINIKTLDIQDNDGDCAICQAFGLDLGMKINNDWTFAMTHGFTLPSDINSDELYGYLTSQWIQEIVRRMGLKLMQTEAIEKVKEAK